jgi:hypothetical protein
MGMSLTNRNMGSGMPLAPMDPSRFLYMKSPKQLVVGIVHKVVHVTQGPFFLISAWRSKVFIYINALRGSP